MPRAMGIETAGSLCSAGHESVAGVPQVLVAFAGALARGQRNHLTQAFALALHTHSR